jgi:hypothetical protein
MRELRYKQSKYLFNLVNKATTRFSAFKQYFHLILMRKIKLSLKCIRHRKREKIDRSF